MIYVPNDENYNSCYVIKDKDTIRVYKELPVENQSIEYKDYFINSHYIYNYGLETFTENINFQCLDNSLITDDFYYRNDFVDILLIFFIFFIFVIYIPLNFIFKLFRKRFI